MSLLWRFCPLVFLLLIVAVNPCFGLNRDGVLLLSLKYSVSSDPLFALESWNYLDETPCSWNGVSCQAVSDATSSSSSSQDRVVGLSLPNSQLLGSIPDDLGLIENLQSIDLSNNSLNGSLPSTLFQSSKLIFLDLSDNLISGEIPDSIVQLSNLHVLNLSDNALAGKLPTSLGKMQNLTFVSVKNNYLSGGFPSGFRTTQVLDLSSNLLNGSLPSDFGGDSLRYLNISFNKFSGKIPEEFAGKIPSNATVDLSFNNLTGEIPDSSVFMNHDSDSFSGNPDLCGEEIDNPCPVSSSPSSSPNDTSPTFPPAFAAFPKTLDSPAPDSGHGNASQQDKTGLRRGTIIGIVVGDIIGMGLLAMIFLYVYQSKRRKNMDDELNKEPIHGSSSSPSSSYESKGFRRWSCLRKKTEEEEEESSSESTGSSDNEVEAQRKEGSSENKTGTLVTVDGGKEMELETLLKASAFILGATGSSIMYKAVLEDGTVLAVRRIGESGVGRFKDFENQVRVVAKLVHANLVRIRGFYWGDQEKLIIYDFVPNGSLANVRYRKVGSSPCHVPWEVRLKIARGVARGLAYLHDKKHVHGNLKPSNILLGNDMEPKIGDFGLEKFVTGDSGYKAGVSARIFGSKRSTSSRDSFQDVNFGPSPSPSPSAIAGVSPYHAPESFRNLKPHPKWDVYSFGIIFLELLTGKIVVTDEMGQGPAGLLVEDKNRALRMADVAIRADMEGKEEALLAYFKIGYSCVSSVPQKRTSMKEVLYALDKSTCSFSPSSSCSYYYGH